MRIATSARTPDSSLVHAHLDRLGELVIVSGSDRATCSISVDELSF